MELSSKSYSSQLPSVFKCFWIMIGMPWILNIYRSVFFFVQIILVILGPLHFHVTFRIYMSISGGGNAGILSGIALNLYFSLENIDILTTLSFPIYEHRMSFHLFRFLICFDDILQFSVYNSYTSLVKCIPQYFILLDAIADEIVFLISFSDYLLLLYRRTTIDI